MSTENLAMLAVGQIIAAGMFALGVLVGCSLRKDAKDDSDEGTKEDKGWHDVVGTGTQGGAERRSGSSARKGSTAGATERAPVGRGAFWE
jgi:hypothetical protein